jgi:hypothetical protein
MALVNVPELLTPLSQSLVQSVPLMVVAKQVIFEAEASVKHIFIALSD